MVESEELEKEIASLKAAAQNRGKIEFNTNVTYGTALLNFAEPSRKFKKRNW